TVDGGRHRRARARRRARCWPHVGSRSRLGDGIRPMRLWLPLLSLLALACRERAPVVGEGPYAEKVALDIPQIEKALGVKFKTPPKLEIRSRDQVRDFLVGKLREPEVVKQIANQEAAQKL